MPSAAEAACSFDGYGTLKPCPDDAARKARLHTAEKNKEEELVLAGLKTRGHMLGGVKEK